LEFLIFDNVEISCDFNNLNFTGFNIEMINQSIIDKPDELSIEETVLILKNSVIKDGFQTILRGGTRFSFLELFEGSELSNFS